MTTPIKNETKRGYEEASKQFELLRTKWPLAFPRAPDKVRPLASGGASILAEALGWSHAYARAVLIVWKLRDTYCRAVLAYSQRINLDGTPSAGPTNRSCRGRQLQPRPGRQGARSLPARGRSPRRGRRRNAASRGHRRLFPKSYVSPVALVCCRSSRFGNRVVQQKGRILSQRRKRSFAQHSHIAPLSAYSALSERFHDDPKLRSWEHRAGKGDGPADGEG